jgi:hypothetical protein
MSPIGAIDMHSSLRFARWCQLRPNADALRRALVHLPLNHLPREGTGRVIVGATWSQILSDAGRMVQRLLEIAERTTASTTG